MIRWAAGRPAVIWACAAGLVVAGAISFAKLPLATKTTVDFPRISVGASWLGASPELVETYLTSPIEAAVQGVRGVRKTSSTSTEGSGNVTVELDPNTDVTMARLAILERMETLRRDLPANARNSVRVGNWVPEDLREEPLLEVNVVGPYTPGALQRIAEDRVEPRLASIEGISDVSVRGGATNGVVLAYDPTRLKQLGIDPAALTSAIGSAKIVASIGLLRTETNERAVVVHDTPKSLDEIARLPVRGPGGRVFALGELASVRPEEDTRGQFYRINGQTAVTLSLERQAGADAIKTAAVARQIIDEIAPTLPPGVILRVERDQSIDLENQLNDLMLRGAIAFGAVLIVLFITMRSGSGSLLVLGSAAVAIAGTALTLYLFHVPANLLTLAGLAMGIGILVQNGLVVVERLRYVPDTADGRSDAAVRIMPAVLGSTLTTSVVLFPFLYLQGNARAAFVPFASAFIIALVWSVVTALILVPAIGRRVSGTQGGWPRLSRLYDRVTFGLLRWRWGTIAFTVALLGVLTWGFVKKVPRNSWGSWWGDQKTTVSASVSFPKGSDPQQVEQIITELEHVAVGRTGVARVVSNGSPYGGQLVVTFTAEGGRTDAPWVISDELTQRAVLVGGAQSVSVSKPEGPGFYGGSGGGSSVSKQVKIMGYSFEGVLQVAKDLQARLDRIPRVRDININTTSFWGRERAVSIALTPDRQALGRVGATATDYAASVGREVRGAANGTRLDIGGEEVQVNVRSIGDRDRQLDQLSEGMVSNSRRAPVRIADVSSVKEIEGLSRIEREDQQYIRMLTYDFRGTQKLADRTHKAFMSSITVPAGYTVSDDQGRWGDDESSKGLWLVFGLGVTLVLLVVALVFDSVWAPAMVFLSLPMALGGVAAAFWITNTAFTREAAVGVILVVGLAVHQAILLIDAVLQARRRHGGKITGADVMRGARDRSAVIVLVTLTTIASLIPMAWGDTSDTLFGAIALATAGGTIAGTVGAMFLLPAFLLGFRWRRRRRRKTVKPVPAPTAA